MANRTNRDYEINRTTTTSTNNNTETERTNITISTTTPRAGVKLNAYEEKEARKILGSCIELADRITEEFNKLVPQMAKERELCIQLQTLLKESGFAKADQALEEFEEVSSSEEIKETAKQMIQSNSYLYKMPPIVILFIAWYIYFYLYQR